MNPYESCVKEKNKYMYVFAFDECNKFCRLCKNKQTNKNTCRTNP